MAELLALIWQKGRVVSFVLNDNLDIERHDLWICPHCECILGNDIDAGEHIADCGGMTYDA